MIKTTWIYKGIELGICLFEGYLYFRMWNQFLTLKHQKIKRALLIMIGVEFFVFLINGLSYPALNLLASVGVHLITCAALFDGDRGKKTYLTVLVWFILSFSEFFVLFVLNMALGKQTVASFYGIWEFLFTAVVAKAVSCLVLEVICRSWLPVMEESDRKILTVFILFPVASILLFAGLAVLDVQFARESESRLFLSFGSLLIFILNLMLLEIYGKVARITNQIKNYERIDTRNGLLNEQYVRTEELRQQIHNVGNRMKTIHILAQQNKNEEILGITRDWVETVERLTSDRYSLSEVLNAILNEKKMEGAHKGIEMSFFVEPGFSFGRVRGEDVIGIVGNLLDNAIEAAEQRTGDGYVKAELFRTNDGKMAMIKVRNNFLKEPEQINGHFVTQKKDKSHHGFGTRYIQDVVKRYEGWCRFSAKEKEFTAVIVIPL